MASTIFSKAEIKLHMKSVEKQVKYLEETERKLNTTMSKDEENALKEEAKDLKKSTELYRRFFNFVGDIWSDKRLKREAYSLRAQKRRAELLKSKGVQLVQSKYNYGEIRIVLNGKSGKGKSALGNNLLGCDRFKSETSLKSITKKCSFGVKYLDRECKLLVVDTPGLFDSEKPNVEMSKKITKCVALAAPGPNIFIFVVSTERFTPEEKDTLTNLQKLFDEKVIDYVIIVFTRKDSLSRRNGIMEFMKGADDILLDLLVKCKFRFAFINNRADPDDVSVDIDVILDLIFKTIGENNGAYYTNDDIGRVDGAFENIIENKEKKKENEIQQLKEQKNKLQDEHQEDAGVFNSKKLNKEKESESEPEKLKEEEKKSRDEASQREFDKIKQRMDSMEDKISMSQTVNNTVNVNPNIEVAIRDIDKRIEETKNINVYYEVKKEIAEDDKNETLGQTIKKVAGTTAAVAAGVAAGAAAVAGAPLVAAGAGVAAAASWITSWW